MVKIPQCGKRPQHKCYSIAYARKLVLDSDCIAVRRQIDRLGNVHGSKFKIKMHADVATEPVLMPKTLGGEAVAEFESRRREFFSIHDYCFKTVGKRHRSICGGSQCSDEKPMVS